MTTARDHITRALTGRRLLDHPFYRRWEAGELGEGELAAYAGQYRHFEAALPTLLTDLVRAMPAGAARDAVAANLADELGPPSHLALFETFATAVGAPDDPPSAAMNALLGAYETAAASGVADGLAGILAYEVQGAEIAASKGAGLRTHYGADDAACAFWDVHATLEHQHADWALDALEDLARDGASIEAAAALVAQSWWEFLDERELVGTSA